MYSLDSWYFGAISRGEAVKQLMQPYNDCGSFLIRDNDYTPGDFVLLIRDREWVRHNRI